MKHILLFCLVVGSFAVHAEISGARIKAKIVRIEGKTATVQVGKKQMQVERARFDKKAIAGSFTEVEFTKEELARILDKNG